MARAPKKSRKMFQKRSSSGTVTSFKKLQLSLLNTDIMRKACTGRASSTLLPKKPIELSRFPEYMEMIRKYEVILKTEFQVYRIYEDPNSLSDEFYDYYGTPQMPAYHSGSPFADYRDYSYETYSYDYNAVYYLQPTYLIYYPVIPVEYSPVYTYLPCYEYAPVYCQDFVLNYNYSVPTSPCYVSDSNFIYPDSVNESALASSPVEPNVFASGEFDIDLYNIENSYLIYYPVINVQYSADYIFYPCYEYVPVYCQDYVFNNNYSVPSTPCHVSESSFIYPDPVYESPLLSSPVKPNVFPSEELDFDLYNIENRYSNDKYERFAEKVGEEITTCYLFYEEYPEKLNGGPVENEANSAATPGKKTSVNGDTLEEFSASRKSCTEVEERRKILNASSKVQKTFINRGVVADPSEYRKFCDSVEDRLKKLRESSPAKKTTTNQDCVKYSSSYRKFCTEVEERRKILNDSSVGKKTYVNRGLVKDPSSYRKFCRIVEDRINKQGSPENSQSFGDQDFIANHGSKVAHEERVVYEGSSHSFMNMILKSAEYLHVEDNIKNPKHYSDILYKQALKKQNKAILMEILPSIVEEPFNLDDVTAECGVLHVAEPRELDSTDEYKPVIIKMKQPKNRLKSFRNWLAKTFCCCCTTNQPP